MTIYETIFLVFIFLVAAFYVYYIIFKKKDCGCDDGDNCRSKTDKDQSEKD